MNDPRRGPWVWPSKISYNPLKKSLEVFVAGIRTNSINLVLDFFSSYIYGELTNISFNLEQQIFYDYHPAQGIFSSFTKSL